VTAISLATALAAANPLDTAPAAAHTASASMAAPSVAAVPIVAGCYPPGYCSLSFCSLGCCSRGYCPIAAAKGTFWHEFIARGTPFFICRLFRLHIPPPTPAFPPGNIGCPLHPTQRTERLFVYPLISINFCDFLTPTDAVNENPQTNYPLRKKILLTNRLGWRQNVQKTLKT
jgi:hypothetical protein